MSLFPDIGAIKLAVDSYLRILNSSGRVRAKAQIAAGFMADSLKINRATKTIPPGEGSSLLSMSDEFFEQKAERALVRAELLLRMAERV